MRIDEALPRWDFSERHAVRVRADATRVWDALRTVDLAESAVVRLLFRLRGLRARGPTIESIDGSGFARLAEAPERELLLGVVGRFWTLSGGLRRIDGLDAFRAFDEPGHAKGAWSFTLAPRPDGGTELVTETRVLCTDAASRRRFRLYWAVVRPFSGWIRREILRLVRDAAERGAP